jgi:hypothetical protein
MKCKKRELERMRAPWTSYSLRERRHGACAKTHKTGLVGAFSRSNTVGKRVFEHGSDVSGPHAHGAPGRSTNRRDGVAPLPKSVTKSGPRRAHGGCLVAVGSSPCTERGRAPGEEPSVSALPAPHAVVGMWRDPPAEAAIGTAIEIRYPKWAAARARAALSWSRSDSCTRRGRAPGE